MEHSKRFDVIGLLAPLRRYAAVLTRDDTDAEDLVHDALVRAYERRHTFHPSGNLRAWLFSVLHNSFVDGQRRKALHAARVRDAADAADTAPPDQETSVRLQQIRRAFLDLPEDQRAALHLVAIEGLSYQEAAGSLGIPLGTLMSRLGRARSALRSFEEGTVPTGRGADGAPPRLRIVRGGHG